MQSGSFTRDVLGRVTQIASAVPNAGTGPGAGEVTGQCFTYDGFNRLAAAWSVADATTVPACDTAAPASDTVAGWDVSAEAYATQWSYSPSGMITQIVNGALAPSSATLTYGGTDGPVHAVTGMSDGVSSNAFEYDDAGRQVSRTVDSVETTLAWDVSSNLVESDGAGGHVVYAYDASGQRVAKIQVADPHPTGAVTAYLGSTEVTDADTSTNADLGANPTALAGTAFVTATRFYTFAGATVAVREATAAGSTLSLMFGDEQGSAQVMMPVQLDALTGAMQAATLADAAGATRNAYAPYGAVRGADNLSIEHGWLNQIADTGTGLTYLNARYYDPLVSRFISPDPLMNPTDPRTLDPYRYADNNPVETTDSSGLCSTCDPDKFDSYANAYGSSFKTRATTSGKYRIAPPTKPKIGHDNYFPYKTGKATVGDYWRAAKWSTIANGARLLRPGLDDGLAAYSHYRSGSGAPFTFDYTEARNEDKSIKAWSDSAIYTAVLAADDLARGRIGTFPITGDEIELNNPATENWQKAIGAHSLWLSGTATTDGNTVILDVVVHAEDYYNFNANAADIGSGAPDWENGRLELIGWAQGFPQSGTYETRLSWPLGNPASVESSQIAGESRNRGGEDRPDRNGGGWPEWIG